MLILGLHSGYHDACACVFDDYALQASVAQERLTRRKSDGGRIPTEAVDECLAIAGITAKDIDLVALSHAAFPARYYTHLTGGRALERAARQVLGREKQKTMERELPRAGTIDASAIFDGPQFLADHGFRSDAAIHFYNHHLSHALPALFHTDWDEALLYTADGGGDNVQYSQRVFRDGEIKTLYGGSDCLLAPLRIDSLGLAYGYATQALGWKINRHEGKLTGLAAYGQPSLLAQLAPRFHVDEDGFVHTDFESYPAMRRFVFELAQEVKREDVAASFQQLLEDVALKSVGRFLERFPVRNLGLAGGIFANVRLNRLLAEELSVDEVFVYPAMSDQGLACGGALDALLARDGLDTWLNNRWRLEDLYFGRDFDGEIDRCFEGDAGVRKISGAPVPTTAQLLEQGRIVAIYTQGMEYGPRALGARSILASPADASVNQSLNDRLERSEFMPFAPVVTMEDVQDVFDLSPGMIYTARFMTITCGVKEHWREKIPAVVHVDDTARPQIIDRSRNPLYYDILTAFKARTGLPVMVNTSFNVHEEPIINTPAECAKALKDGRIDYVVTDAGVYEAA
jgi:carbamoyltransferase